MSRVILEVCVGSLEDAQIAYQGGADRLELNSALSLGGLTPSSGLLRLVQQVVPLPIIAMLRPREGGFCYTPTELETLHADLDDVLAQNVAGVAFGVLHSDGTINREACQQIRSRCVGREVVFHRAFDLTPDPFAALETLIELGFDRILTSGQQPTALEGADCLRQLIQQAGQRIEILPGAGIRVWNVRQLLRQVPVAGIHASLQSERVDPSIPQNGVIRFSERADGNYRRTDLALVAEFRKILDSATDVARDDSI